MTTPWSAYYATANSLVNNLERDNDGNANDCGLLVPWRSNLTPGAEYATTANGTHAGTAPLYGAYEWIAYNATNTVFSSLLFYVKNLTTYSTHEFSDCFNFSGTYPAAANGKSAFNGELSGAILLNVEPSSGLGVGSTLYMKVHNRDTLADVGGRWLVEIDPMGHGVPSEFEHYVSATTFTFSGGAVNTLTLAADTPFYRYHPETRLNVNQANLGDAVYPPFRKVVGVGWTFENDTIVVDVSPTIQRITVRAYSVNAVAPPSLLTLITVR